VILLTLGFTLPLCAFFFSFDAQYVVAAWYAHNVRGLRLQHELGFKTGPLTGVASGTALWGITSVVPGGAFAVAGVRVGDVPRQASFKSVVDGRPILLPLWYHGNFGAVPYFYHFLEVSRGQGVVTFTVCRPETISPDRPCQEREVRISVPGK
jgi:hypothetical protein